MPSYKQLSKYNWKVQVSLGYKDGKKQLTRKQGFKTKKDAERWATEILNKANKGYILPTTNNILFKDFLLKWFNDHKSKTLSINTYTNYNSRIQNHIIPKLGSYKLTEINNITIQNFYNDLLGQNLKPSSVKKVMEILNGCFKYAKKNKLIYSIPTDIEKVKLDKPIIEFWCKEDLDFFLNEIKDSYLYFPIMLDVLTGLRVGELCGLKWKYIDLQEGYIHICGQIIFNKETKELIYTPILKTDKSYRKISIPPLLIDFLDNLKKIEKPNGNDYVLKNREGDVCNPRNLSMEFTKKVSKYKLDLDELREKYPNKNLSNYRQLKQISFHALRHTHATLLILNNENIKVVSERLGHKDISTTLQTYTHVMKDMEQNTATLLQNMFINLVPNSTQKT